MIFSLTVDRLLVNNGLYSVMIGLKVREARYMGVLNGEKSEQGEGIAGVENGK